MDEGSRSTIYIEDTFRPEPKNQNVCEHSLKLSGLIDKTLDAKSNRLLLEHLNLCSLCQKEFAVLQKNFTRVNHLIPNVSALPRVSESLSEEISELVSKTFNNSVLKSQDLIINPKSSVKAILVKLVNDSFWIKLILSGAILAISYKFFV